MGIREPGVLLTNDRALVAVMIVIDNMLVEGQEISSHGYD
jgi:hypothetical protein